MICKYFLSPRKTFHFLDAVLWSKFDFNFDEEPFVYFLFGCFCFQYLIYEVFANSRLWKVTPMFSPKSFVVLALTFRSLTHFELIGCVVWCKGSTSLLYMWHSSFHRTIYWKDFYAHIGWFWWLSQNSVKHRCAGLFLDSQFYSRDLTLFLTTLSWLPFFCSKFEIGKCESSKSVLLFQYCFG